MMHKSKCHQAVMFALFPVGVYWHALGHVDSPPSLHAQSRDTGRLAD